MDVGASVRLSSRVLDNNPIYRKFLMASTISLLGNNIFDISMPLYVWERTHSAFALSLVTIALQLPYFIMAPITGYAVDHYDNRKLMLLSDIGGVVLLSLLLILDLTTTPRLAPILIAVFAAKTLAILFETVATFHLIPSLVKRQDLSEANTWFLSSQRLIQIVGPLTGGLLVGFIGFQASIFVNILSFAATLFFVYRMRDLSRLLHAGRPTRTTSLSFLSVKHSFAESVRYVWKSPLFRALIFTMFFWNLSSLTPTTASITYYFRAERGYSPVDYGAVISIFGLFSICGFVISSSLYHRLTFRKAFYGSVLWQAAFATIAVCFVNYPMLFIFFFSLSRLGSSIVAMGTFLIRQTEVPRSQSGSINSTLRMHFMSSGPVSGGAQGFLMERFGVLSSFIFGAACLWATAFWGRRIADAHPHVPKGQEQEAA